MTTACIINDFIQNRRMFLLFSEAEFQRIDAVWNNSDRLLADLQSNELFQGRTRWCDLEPFHFGCIIMKNLTYAAELKLDEQNDERNSVVRSLHFLLMALVRAIECKAHCSVEILHVNRIAETEVAFNYSAAINMAIELNRNGKDNQKLRIIVDNTNRDEEE